MEQQGNGRWRGARTATPLLVVGAFVVSAAPSACASKDEAPPPTATAPGSAQPTGAAHSDRDDRRPSEKKGDSVASKEEALPSPPAARPQVAGGASPTDAPTRPETVGPEPGGATGARPLAAVAEVTAGQVSSEVIARVVSENLERFRPCAAADAKVALRLTLGPAGSVASAESPRSQPDEPRLRDCVVDAVRALRFPRDPGSDASVVSFELVLTRPPF